METTLQNYSWVNRQASPIKRIGGVGWGVIAGFAGTMVMDFILMGALSIGGLPAHTCFSIVGNTVARFFSLFGIQIPGGVLPGVMTHYLVGPLVGAIFGAAMDQVKVFRVNSLKKAIVLAVLYVEILSQPILASAPILLKMTAAETWQWFSGSFVMHLIWGIILGVVVSQGLNLTVTPNSK